MRWPSLLALLVAGRVFGESSVIAVRHPAADSLRIRIERRIAGVPGAVVGVAFADLGSGDTLYLGADERFHAASTMKVRSCDEMRAILLRQEFSAEIPAGLPAGTPVAHKTGWITGVLHAAAIVYPRGRAPYVLAVLTRGIPKQEVARSLIADISRLVYEHATGVRVAGAAPGANPGDS